jgi:hypothetical protein
MANECRWMDVFVNNLHLLRKEENVLQSDGHTAQSIDPSATTDIISSFRNTFSL